LFRRVIVSRGVSAPEGTGDHPRRGSRRSGLLREIADLSATPSRPGPHPGSASSILRPARVGALVFGLIALLTLIASEFALPVVLELAVAAILLGFGIAGASPLAGTRLPEAPAPSRPLYLDPQEQIRRQVRLLERRRLRCLDTLAEVERCATVERAAGRPTDRLDVSATALAEAVAAFDAGIRREQAAGLALQVTRWLDRLPSLVEGLERLDLGAYPHRLERLERVAQDGEALAAALLGQPCADEPTARKAFLLLEAGREEVSRLRVDLLAHEAALLARGQPSVHPPIVSAPAAEIERALGRGWDWICRTEACRELRNWAQTPPASSLSLPEPVTITLPRGRDLGMLPFSLILLGFTGVHATLAVSSVAPAVPLLLLPMAGFYALFLFPGVQLFREAVKARRREELTVCGSAVMLRWHWGLWNGVETVVVAPDAPVRRDNVAYSGDHPIRRLCLEGVDGRKLYFGFGLTDAQHARIIRRLARPALPPLPEHCEEHLPACQSDAVTDVSAELGHDTRGG
jgi:hypothetical protein